MKPITTELRLFISGIGDDLSKVQSDRLFELCDAIDAVDASLASENKELVEKYTRLHANVAHFVRAWKEVADGFEG